MSDPLSALAAEADAAAAAAAAADAAAAAAAASDTSAVVATAASNSSSSSGYATTTKEEDDVDDASVVIPASSSTSAAASPFPPPDTPSPEKKAEEAEEELFKSALDRDNEDLFTSAVSEIESEPPKVSDTDDIFKTEETHGNTEPPLEDVSLEQDQLPEIRLSSSVAPQDLEDVEEEEENPFKDAHLTPELQLSSGATAPSAGVVATNGTGASSLVDPEDFIRVKVSDPEKVGEGLSSHVVFSVHTKTNVSFFKAKEMTVKRRFSDFLGLHEKLRAKYLANGRLIPPVPEKDGYNITRIKINNEDLKTEPFLAKRADALTKYLNRVAAHPIFRTDPDFRDLISLDAELPKATDTSALSGKNWMRLIGRLGDKMSTMTLKMEENDPWFEDKTMKLRELDAYLNRLCHASEELHALRIMLQEDTSGLSSALAALSGMEEDSKMAAALAKLSEVQENLFEVHQRQSQADQSELVDLFRDYQRVTDAVKEIFQERQKAWQHWQSQSTHLTKKREAKVKAELQMGGAPGGMPRMSQLRQEIAESEHATEMAQENFEKMSRMIKKEYESFDVQRRRDLREHLLSYFEKMLEAQEEVAQQWETFLPEVKRMAAAENN